MPFDPYKHHRRSIRLPGYDYSQAGLYHVVMVTRERECLFGAIEDGCMKANLFGQMVMESWLWLAEQYEYVYLDEWILMPNHLHGIICLVDGTVGAVREPPLPEKRALIE
jgi:hypothetical protein